MKYRSHEEAYHLKLH